MRNKAGIYKLTSPNGKVYIGQSVQLKNRIGKYKALDCKNQTHLHRAIIKYGWDSFTVEILWGTDDLTNIHEILNMLEVDFINLYDCIENGYNIREGGDNGAISEETKEKMRATALRIGTGTSEENKERLRTMNIGRKHGAEAKLNYSRAAKKRCLKPVLQYSLEGIFIKEYPSVRDAKAANERCSKIDAVCRGERSKAGGYIWKYKENKERSDYDVTN